MEVRADFGPVYLLNFASLAFVIAWLLIAGRAMTALSSAYCRGINSVFSLSFQQLIGRHSLHVYVWHVLSVLRSNTSMAASAPSRKPPRR